LRPEVLVVGAGPTGLTVACQLRRLGVSVRIVDKKAGFSATSKAIGLQYRVSDILACMGVADRSLAKGEHANRGEHFCSRSPACTVEVRCVWNRDWLGRVSAKSDRNSAKRNRTIASAIF